MQHTLKASETSFCTIEHFDAEERHSLRADVMEVVARGIVKPVGQHSGTSQAIYSENALYIAAAERVLDRAKPFMRTFSSSMPGPAAEIRRAENAGCHAVSPRAVTRGASTVNRMAHYFP